jgi:hypothetical protein
MTGFTTFSYSKKYFVSQEIEFVTEPDLEFGETYKPPEDLINLLADNLIVYDKVGIGSTTPTSNLTVNGSVLISGISTFETDIRLKGPLQDKFANSGTLGQVLLSGSNSVFWGDVSGVGTPLQTIGIYDENTFQGTVSNLNFLDGTDPNNLVSATIGLSSSFANITISDRWSLSGSDVYRMSKVGIQNASPTSTLDITGTLHATGAVDFDSTLNVDDATTLNSTLDVDGATTLNSTLDVDGATTLNSTLDVDGATTLNSTLDVDGDTILNAVTQSTSKDTGGLITQGGVGIEKNLNVGGDTKLTGTLELDSSLIDINGNTAGPSVGKTDYRLSSVGTGVSWRPPGVQTQNIIYVTKDGNDSNTGLLEGDAKATVGGAAAVAQEGDTIIIRSGVYFENNPIGLRTDVSITGQDLRLVTIVPNNVTKDVFHVRRGCLIENLNFAGSSVSIAHTDCAAVAFPPTDPAKFAASGFIASGPATEGTSGRWRSPYIRNCTNFMSKSIGMKIDGDHATASTIGADLKSMVCDSFTQYNEAGIGVSLTNNGYAQLVSIFTINCDIGIFAGSGGQCDLTNSNSSFGNFGLVAVGLGSTEFTGKVNTTTTSETDTIIFKEVEDGSGNVRRPYDGQALWFKIDLVNYNTGQVGIITAPLQQLKEIRVINGGSGFSQASPPDITIFDTNTLDTLPLGPEGIVAELSPTISDSGAITSVDVVNNGRNYLSSQPIGVRVNGISTNDLVAVMEPIFYTVGAATSTTPVTGITTVTLNQFLPYLVYEDDEIEMRRISRILTSGHSFEYIGTGTDINTSTPLKGAVPIKENEIVFRDGGQIPFTSTDQQGNFNIGEGIQINQQTSTITGRDFSKAIQAEVTPLILALR